MEELFKLAVMAEYLRALNVKDTTTIARIELLENEARTLASALAEKFLAEKFPEHI